MKAVILTEGGKGIGFGHVTRCLSLYDEFRTKGVNTVFIANDDKILSNRLSEEAVKYLPYGKHGGIEGILKSESPDIILIDSYLMDRKTYRTASRNVNFSVAIDDNRRMDYPTDMILNSAVYAAGMNYGNKRKDMLLLGPSYFPSHCVFKKAKGGKIKEKVKRVLVTFGGGDSKNMTPKVIRYITRNFRNIRIEAVIGAGVSDISYAADPEFRKRVKFHFNTDMRKICRLMLNSDIAISAGGQTLYELAITGTPSIGVCVAKNQLKNLKAWHENGFVRFAGWHDDPDLLKNIGRHLREFSSKGARRRARNSALGMIDAKGAKRAVGKILEKAKIHMVAG